MLQYQSRDRSFFFFVGDWFLCPEQFIYRGVVGAKLSTGEGNSSRPRSPFKKCEMSASFLLLRQCVPAIVYSWHGPDLRSPQTSFYDVRSPVISVRFLPSVPVGTRWSQIGLSRCGSEQVKAACRLSPEDHNPLQKQTPGVPIYGGTHAGMPIHTPNVFIIRSDCTEYHIDISLKWSQVFTALLLFSTLFFPASYS